ncbi:alkaline phosphatase D family protein [Allobranchiibius huperziae]|uniref:Phosphodiesterase/alkaline phosphatase D-like protein n=1 Tax=Allobranchiibius huperziae TaxID=1874116 RepID=A0A853DEZ4_9MICO|nr:alkaline phosphatase D family protein [Allobranchiibius huperziae]NYJ75247.1 phosphodiesterase/alkaline phosphatase D-like protein [Allobranchiibius huperziae]
MPPPLVLGPLLRHVGETTATIWVETAAAGQVEVRSEDGHTTSVPTFAAHGHHYAIVLVEGLEPGSVQDYQVAVDGGVVWPVPGDPYPPCRIATLDRSRPSHFLYGSCRTSVPHDKEGTKSHGVDALRAYAVDMIRDPAHWPDFVLFLGDQLYADETSRAMREFIKRRRGLDDPPGPEVKDFVEYAELYRLAWSDPANRWLLSTLSSAMIFDDHDVRDDWNTSRAWHEEMNKLPWWRDRIKGALASYWIYQHAGNLAPDELRQDEIWRQIAAHDPAEGELDITEVIEAFADRVDREPETYRFSFTRDLGESRLVVIDSRNARVLEPGKRAMLDAKESRWFDEQLHGDTSHLFIGTSLPFFLPPAIHDLESIDETMAGGAWGGPRTARLGEKLREAVDLEHWAAFERSFAHVLQRVVEVARGQHGEAPATITFLSGDVHNSYITQVQHERYALSSRILQVVCSPIRNPLPRHVRMLQGTLANWTKRPMRRLARRLPQVRRPAYEWDLTHGPWFDNNMGGVEVLGDRLLLTWARGVVSDGQYDQPRLDRVSTVLIG